ncbi:MAG: glutamine amidotransferase [Thermomicrobiales bacterium]
MSRVLIAGESWIMHTIHQKGFDSFTTTAYGEGHQWLTAALTSSGHEVSHLPNHLANDQFPMTAAELREYDAVLLSDIGANTLLLSERHIRPLASSTNRLESAQEYTEQGGGLVMIGGYLTFPELKGRGCTPVRRSNRRCR